MKFQEIKEIISSACEKYGVAEYEVTYSIGENISAETLKDEISAFSSGESAQISFRCIVDGHMGYASTSYFDADEIEDLVVRASDNARAIENDDVVVIFKGSESYGKTTAPDPEVVDAATLKEKAMELQKKAYAVNDAVVDGTQSIAISFRDEIYMYNSHGLELSNRVGMTGCYVAAVVNKDGESRDNFEFADSVNGEKFEELPAKAVNGALEKIGASEISTGKYNVVIDGSQMRALLSAFSPSFSAKNAILGMSMLAGKEGEKIAADIVTITDDPMRDGVSIQTNFDAEGVAARRKSVVENGVLKTLLHNRETAAVAGVESTGNASKGGYASPVGISPYAFCIEAGDKTEEELLAMAEGGIYITELKGLHAGANPVTGDFSLESAGFKIVDGKKGEAVKTFTISGNFFELMKSISAMSDKVEVAITGGFTTFGAPAVLVPDMSVAGT